MPIDITNKEEKQIALTGVEIESALLKANDIQSSASEIDNSIMATGNVKNYGAKGNGITDDTASIQSCINYVASTGGGVVFLPTGVYKTTSTITITNASYSGDFGNGGVTLRGANMRSTKIKAYHSGIAVSRPSNSMGSHVEDLHIEGQGKTDTGSIGLELKGTGGNTNLNNVYISYFETGMTNYDVTLVMANNLAIRYCTKGLSGRYQGDIFTFIGSRFDYCTNAIYLGEYSDVHLTGSLEENCINFIGCRISNNTEAITVKDYGASGVKFTTCYFEGNIREGTIGDSSYIAGMKSLLFDGCYFNAYATQTQGFKTYNNLTIELANSKIDFDGTPAYPFLDLVHGGSKLNWKNNYVSTLTSIKYREQSFFVNPKEHNFSLNFRNIQLVDAGYSDTDMAIELGMANANGKTLMSLSKRNGATNAMMNEMSLKCDATGVLILGGSAIVNDIPSRNNTTANRPTASLAVGQQYFDTTLGKPIWWKGTVWVDATGATV